MPNRSLYVAVRGMKPAGGDRPAMSVNVKSACTSPSPAQLELPSDTVRQYRRARRSPRWNADGARRVATAIPPAACLPAMTRQRRERSILPNESAVPSNTQRFHSTSAMMSATLASRAVLAQPTPPRSASALSTAVARSPMIALHTAPYWQVEIGSRTADAFEIRRLPLVGTRTHG